MMFIIIESGRMIFCFTFAVVVSVFFKEIFGIFPYPLRFRFTPYCLHGKKIVPFAIMTRRNPCVRYYFNRG